MADFKFSCPHCDQPLMCDHTAAGRQIQCPHCNVLIRIPPDPYDASDYDPQSGATWDTFVPSGNVVPLAGLSMRG